MLRAAGLPLCRAEAARQAPRFVPATSNTLTQTNVVELATVSTNRGINASRARRALGPVATDRRSFTGVAKLAPAGALHNSEPRYSKSGTKCNSREPVYANVER